jgi:hypothetical protein
MVPHEKFEREISLKYHQTSLNKERTVFMKPALLMKHRIGGNLNSSTAAFVESKFGGVVSLISSPASIKHILHKLSLFCVYVTNLSYTFYR